MYAEKITEHLDQFNLPADGPVDLIIDLIKMYEESRGEIGHTFADVQHDMSREQMLAVYAAVAHELAFNIAIRRRV